MGMSISNLAYRRQFVLCNAEIKIPENWIHYSLNKCGGNFKIFVHPDLAFEHFQDDTIELVLLGYILDPFNPSLTSLDVLKKLASLADFGEIIHHTDKLSGRFVIVYSNQDSLKIFNDAAGLREVYYFSHEKTMACASTCNILAEMLFVERDNDPDLLHFYNSSDFKHSRERIWIGNRTPFKGILHLLPNKYYDVLNNKEVRFWPKEMVCKSYNDLQGINQEILTGTMTSAVKRFSIHQSITGGWDSRLLLAASRSHLEKIHFYFIRGFKSDAQPGKKKGDFEITKALAEKFGFPVDFVQVKNQVDSDFENIYYQNNVFARPKLLSVFFDVFCKRLDQTVTLSGTSGNEILRLISMIDRNITDPHQIADTLGYGKYLYVVDSIEAWLSDIIYSKKMGYHIIDMFNWEQLMGNWGALGAAEQDIVREELRPFNNRTFYSSFLQMKDNQRYKDYPKAYIEMIRHLWPELFEIDLDMSDRSLKNLFRYLHIEILVDKFYHRLKTYERIFR